MTRLRNKLALAVWLLCSFAASAQTPALLLFGGVGHKTFLGCLNCGDFDSGSVCNQFGKGNQFESDSIWNQFGDYGSQFSSQSPWNQFSTDAPVIVDRNGNFYGHMSANQFHDKRTRIALFNTLAEMGAKDLAGAEKAFCRR